MYYPDARRPRYELHDMNEMSDVRSWSRSFLGLFAHPKTVPYILEYIGILSQFRITIERKKRAARRSTRFGLRASRHLTPPHERGHTADPATQTLQRTLHECGIADTKSSWWATRRPPREHTGAAHRKTRCLGHRLTLWR